ncbi:MAG: hypothetical protein ACC660_02480, partial [Acidimicrobiales bacterium]
KQQNPEILRRKEPVKAAVGMRGVPEGTPGRVILSHGLNWVRYWVRFDNGVEMGSIHRQKLVRESEWNTYLVERDQAVEDTSDPVEASTGDGPAAGTTGAGATVNGVQVPQLLLDRTESALERLGVSR